MKKRPLVRVQKIMMPTKEEKKNGYADSEDQCIILCSKYLFSLLHEVAPNSVTLNYYLTTSSGILWVKSSVRVGLLKPFPFFKRKESYFYSFYSVCVCFWVGIYT